MDPVERKISLSRHSFEPRREGKPISLLLYPTHTAGASSSSSLVAIHSGRFFAPISLSLYPPLAFSPLPLSILSSLFSWILVLHLLQLMSARRKTNDAQLSVSVSLSFPSLLSCLLLMFPLNASSLALYGRPRVVGRPAISIYKARFSLFASFFSLHTRACVVRGFLQQFQVGEKLGLVGSCLFRPKCVIYLFKKALFRNCAQNLMLSHLKLYLTLGHFL